MNNSNDRSREIVSSNMPLWYYKARHSIYFVLGVIQVLIGLRLIFKLLGANPGSGFVAFLYSISGIFTAPFSGIFDSFVSSGLSAKSVFEPAAVIGMVLYGILAWGLVSFLRISASKGV